MELKLALQPEVIPDAAKQGCDEDSWLREATSKIHFGSEMPK